MTFSRIEDMKLESLEGLRIIPIEILQAGTKKIVEYMLDLYRSSGGDPFFRSKLMVVGYENVGKTTILDCLFPLKGYLAEQRNPINVTYWFKLQGNSLSRYEKRKDVLPLKVTVFENRQWEVVALPNDHGIKITPRQSEGGKEEIALYCGDKVTQEVWLGRLRRVCMNEATHGIEIQSHSIDNDITREYFRKSAIEGKKIGGSGKVEVSVWDFAGQEDYYNNHHYFLSTRTVFLVLWKMSEGDEKGMKGLDFWFRSLATHLGSSSSHSVSSPLSERRKGEGKLAPEEASSSGTYYSIIVVGTFLDHPLVKREEKRLRQKKIEKIARKSGLASSSLQYYEVSCSSSLENIREVQDGVARTMLSHTYMGERVPRSYVAILDYLHGVNELRKERVEHSKEIKETMKEKEATGSKIDPYSSDGNELPIIKVDDVSKMYGEDLVKRALGLFSLWGECVYFESPPELANIVILDPRFLTKGILADLFRADPHVRGMKKGGVVRHADLHQIWGRFFTKGMSGEEFSSLCSTFMTLLQTLGVCFVIEEDRSKPFMEQRSIIPSLLPPRYQANAVESNWLKAADFKELFDRCWPLDAPFDRPVEMERSLHFNVVPVELVSRLLVHLHGFIQSSLVWRDEALLFNQEDNTQVWIRISIPAQSFCMTLRGSNEESCLQLLFQIVEEIKATCKAYPGVAITEAIRSPFSSNTLIPLKDINKAKRKDLQLKCPETHFPLTPEILLSFGGYLQLVSNGTPPRFFSSSFSFDHISRIPFLPFSRAKMVGEGVSGTPFGASLCCCANTEKRRIREICSSTGIVA